MTEFEDNKMYIGDQTFLGYIARSSLSPVPFYINEFPTIDWILNPDQIFFTSSDAVYDGSEDYYQINFPNIGMAKSTRLYTNATTDGDGIRELIRKTTVSEEAGIWHFQELLDSDGAVTGIATRPGKAFELGVNYLLTYHATEKPV